MHRSTVVSVLVLLGAAVIYTWPLLERVTLAIPGGPTDRDVATMIWNVGHVHRALTRGDDMLSTREVLVPFGADLRLHTYGLLQGLAAAPLVQLVGLPGAFNLMLAGTLVLNGVVGYALIVRESGSRAAALVAATCFMLSSSLLDQIRVGRPTFGSLWIVAGALLVAGSLVDAPRLWKGVLLGLFLVAALLTDFQVVLFCALWLAIYGLVRFRPRHAIPLALAALVSAVPFGLVFYPALADAAETGYPQPSAADMVVYSFRFWDYADPAVVAHAYGFELGAGAVAACLVLGRRGKHWLWLGGAVVCLVLALGPLLQPTELKLPFAFLSTWPPLAQFRTPYRLAMPAALGLAVVLGLVLARPLERLCVWMRSIAVGLLVLLRVALASTYDPLTIQSYPSYAFYDRIAAEAGRFALLEVPFGVRSGLERLGDGGEVLEFYQHVHGKPLLNGMVARVPSTVFQAYRAHPALTFLSGDTGVTDAKAIEHDLAEVLRWVDVRYVVVHRDLLSSEQAQRIEAVLEHHPALYRDVVEGDLKSYHVRQTP
jgi:hypothetical protein